MLLTAQSRARNDPELPQEGKRGKEELFVSLFSFPSLCSFPSVKISGNELKRDPRKGGGGDSLANCALCGKGKIAHH